MDLYVDTLAEFGRRLGLSSLAPNDANRVELHIEKIGLIQIEPVEDGVLFTLARPWPLHAERTAMTALSLCHWRENHPWPINAGARGTERLLFTAWVAREDFLVPTLDRVIDHLARLHDAVERAG